MDGKVALLTGAMGGIGQACARRLSAEGARLVLVDLEADRLHALARELGGTAICVCADVGDAAQTKGYVEAALRGFGLIDIALLNAGIEGPVGSIAATPVEAFDRVMQVNVRGVWLALAQLMPAMRQQGGGSIVITASIAGLRGSAGQGAYVASKHAVIGLTKVAALEGAPDGIRVNAVCPGAIETRMMKAIETGFDAAQPDAVRARIVAGIAQKRYGTAEEVAALMCFVAGDAAGYCTGSVFPVDGGAMAGSIR